MGEELANLKADVVVDARGQSCPGPMLEAKKALTKVKSGQILEILSSDKGTRRDLPTLCKKTGDEYLGFIEEGGYDRHLIRKK
ncbi:sulfurtransferase TusA family protein [Archaeoglobus neptunius]|uniref:sulfurtransferase TusA family protein n=1 Tax=Archaeoglobus neptunius TaxID=2798580 RepID=UPI0019252F15|nr:sulfurtransferase TusA family protein [Archaeoglobus neptunius]